jgi:hypothetical protein
MFRFEKPGAYAQTLKSKNISAVRLENRGSGAIAPNKNTRVERHTLSLAAIKNGGWTVLQKKNTYPLLCLNFLQTALCCCGKRD